MSDPKTPVIAHKILARWSDRGVHKLIHGKHSAAALTTTLVSCTAGTRVAWVDANEEKGDEPTMMIATKKVGGLWEVQWDASPESTGTRHFSNRALAETMLDAHGGLVAIKPPAPAAPTPVQPNPARDFGVALRQKIEAAERTEAGKAQDYAQGYLDGLHEALRMATEAGLI